MIALPKVYTIPSGAPFAKILAQTLWHEYADDLLALSDVQIYLPNRRSCRAVADAFLEISDGKATLLPQLTPLGDIDEDDLFDTDPFILDEDPYLTPAIHPLERQLLLTSLVAAKPNIHGVAEAFALAGELARLIDKAHTESVDLKKIASIVPSELAEHWKQTQEFLEIVTDAWPKYLADNTLSDPAQRRNIAVEKKIAALRAKPPQHRVIAAGSTGSIPAVAKLLDVIARLPQGQVILSGFHYDEKIWDAIDETHPHFYQKNLLARMELDPASVKPWPLPAEPHYLLAQRRKLADLALQPAAVFDLSDAKTDIEPPQFIAAEDTLHEAMIVALRLREILNDTGKTALVVTPDRLLAKRICDEMGRWGIALNDSAGETLDQKPVGRFLLMLTAFGQNAAPMTAVTALLSHPLCRPSGDLDALKNFMRNKLLPPGGLAAWRSENALLAQALDNLAPLATNERKTLREWAEALIVAAEKFSPPETLWHGDDGEAAAELLRDLMHQPKSAELPLDAFNFDRILRHILTQQVIRPRFGTHPRLRLLSPIEARLEHADHVILCGLNEGVWPAQPSPNPWLSRPMLAEMGFGSAERRIGQSALDFVNLFCCPNLTVTWSKKRDGAASPPSRWIQQIAAVLEKNDRILPESDPLYHYATQWDHPEKIQPRPAPEGASSRKPEKIRVTDVGKWKQDPYSYYAKRILGLKKTDPLDRRLEARDWGNAAHDILEKFFDSADRSPETYRAICDETLRRYPLDPSLDADWRNRLAMIGEWLTTQNVTQSETEADISYPFQSGDVKIMLQGRADRVDTTPEGLIVIDYKTNTPPSNPKINSGEEPQLGLLGYLLENKRKQKIAGLGYIQLTGKKSEPAKINPIKDPGNAMRAANDALAQLLADHYADGKPYPAVALAARKHDDYRHLKRTQEWSSVPEDDENEGGEE